MRQTLFTRAALVLGLLFLYLPIVVLVLFSFNASRLVTVWAGLSTQWYGDIWRNAALLQSLWISLRVAAASATIATLVGTALAVAVSRLRPFRGRGLLAFLGYVPLVLPEIITGLSLLLLFIALGLERGILTITLAHATFTTGFVAIIVQARLALLDRSLEEAAADLGATPLDTLLRVTLPLAAPAVAAGWLLAFTLSLDDLVIASFTSGPGATTLTMRIYSQIRLGVTPEINAISTLMIGVAALAALAVTLALRRTAQR